MNQPHPSASATSLFFGAIADLLRAPGTVARIAALPVAIFVLLQIPVSFQYVTWYNTPSESAPPTEWVEFLFFLVMLGFVASAWHRFKVNGVRPSGLWPEVRFGTAARYVLAWIVIGIIVGLLVVLFVALPVLGIATLIDPVLSQSLGSLVFPEGIYGGEVSDYGMALYVAVGAVLGLAYIWLLFRMGMGLPSVAVNDGEGLGMRASWKATRSLAWPILGAAVFATIGQGLLYGLSMSALWLNGSFDGFDLTFAGELATRLVTLVVDVVNLLVGAAILTRIYRAVPAGAL